MGSWAKKENTAMPSSKHSTLPTPPRTPFVPHFLICSFNTLYALSLCPNAQTLLAHDIDHDENLVLALPCKQWNCRWCACRKIAALSYRTSLAKPNRLLTLTVNPALYETPREAFDKTRRCVPSLFSALRKRFLEVEYLRVTELTRLGWPHYHCLVRSPYLPHTVVKSAWSQLTGATIVDVRQVDKAFKAYSYLVKYLSKLHEIEWTERHVSYSRRFFPASTDDAYPKRNLFGKTIVPLHPYTYLEQNYHGQRIAQTSPGTFRVDLGDPCDPPDSRESVPSVAP